jgi:hypothetical protein
LAAEVFELVSRERASRSSDRWQAAAASIVQMKKSVRFIAPVFLSSAFP